MSIYCPLAEALGIPTTISILDIEDKYDDTTIIRGAHTGYLHSDETKELIRQKKLGVARGPHSDETRKKIGLGNKGKVRTAEMNEQNRQWHLGRSFTLPDEAKERMSKIALNRTRHECPICKKMMTKQAFVRYGHGTNCKGKS